jgi:hypothetical protein
VFFVPLWWKFETLPVKHTMADRFQLIARKNEVRQQLARLRLQLEREQAKLPPVPPRQLARLEQQLEQLMAEEYTLRVAIDQSK